jgi:hypothetical protein
MAPAYPERQPPYLKLTRTFAGSDALEEELRVLLAADLLGLEAAAPPGPEQHRLGVVHPVDLAEVDLVAARVPAVVQAAPARVVLGLLAVLSVSARGRSVVV